MVLDDLIELKKDERPKKGFYMFERKAARARELTKEKAAKKNLFTNKVILRLLSMYRKPHYYPDKHQFGNLRRLNKMGVKSSDIKKIKDGPIEMIYITENGVKTILNYFYERKCIEDYKKKDVLKDLKTIASLL